MGQRYSAKELRAQLETLLSERLLSGPAPELVALSTAVDFEEQELECAGRRYRVCRARSVLEFYDQVERAAGQPLLVLTELADQDLGLDLRSRLYKRRILNADPWQTVKHLFACREVEASLVAQPHLAHYLLQSQPVEGYSKVKGEVLTADKAWSCLFTFRLQMPSHYLDSLTLLEWAHAGAQAYLEAPEDLKTSARERIHQVCGELGAAVLELLEDGSFSPLAMGLALRCLVDDKPPQRGRREALVRLERYVGDRALEPRTLRDWAEAAEHLATAARLEAGPDPLLLSQADRALEALQAQTLADRSTLLPLGLAARYQTLGEALKAATPPDQDGTASPPIQAGTALPPIQAGTALPPIQAGTVSPPVQAGAALPPGGAPGSPAADSFDPRLQAVPWVPEAKAIQAVYRAVERCLQHLGVDERQREALDMLPRLLRWLATPEPAEPGSLGQLAQAYARDEAFADWAWLRSQGRLNHPALVGPMNGLHGLVDQRLERQARAFALTLAAWNRAGEPPLDQGGAGDGDGAPSAAGGASAGTAEPLWLVEQLIPKLLVPIAAAKGGRFLLLVLDGCAWPTLHELLHFTEQRHWRSLAPEGSTVLPGLLSTYPCLTEGARASLLSGRLTAGDSSVEKRNFSQHPDLRTACNSSRPPLLFHKGDLGSGRDTLPSELRDKIADPKNKAVAVVLNAIDDHLERTDQLEVTWRPENIAYLSQLLNEAHSAGRLVVLASDHGHLLENDAVLQRPGPNPQAFEDTGDVGGASVGPGSGVGAGGGTGDGAPVISAQGGARWRLPGPGSPAASPGEVLVGGPRALVPGQKVVLSWSSRLRYTRKKCGYHGGAHPRELLAPLWVLAPVGRDLPGWVETHLPKPPWWHAPHLQPEKPPGERSEDTALTGPELLGHLIPSRSVEASGQMLLPVADSAPPSLAQAVMAFPPVAAQWSKHRGQVDAAWAQRLLELLEQGGDRAAMQELAADFQVSEPRFHELLAEAANLLTVDGNYLLSLTLDARTLLLDRGALAALLPRGEAPGQLEVEGLDGQTIRFSVPLPALEPQERLILETLARHRELSESELKKALGTRRGGPIEKLMEKLAQAGYTALKQTGSGPQGRIYRLDLNEA